MAANCHLSIKSVRIDNEPENRIIARHLIQRGNTNWLILLWWWFCITIPSSMIRQVWGYSSRDGHHPLHHHVGYPSVSDSISHTSKAPSNRCCDGCAPATLSLPNGTRLLGNRSDANKQLPTAICVQRLCVHVYAGSLKDAPNTSWLVTVQDNDDESQQERSRQTCKIDYLAFLHELVVQGENKICFRFNISYDRFDVCDWHLSTGIS